MKQTDTETYALVDTNGAIVELYEYDACRLREPTVSATASQA